MTPLFDRVLAALDARTGVSRAVKEGAQKVFPSHWSFLLGEIALFTFLILVASGVFLAMFYRPSIEPVPYTGDATLYQGRELPAAFGSILGLTHDVPGGAFVRRVHRAAAQLFVGSITLHFLRVLLTGAFRRPRELNYHLGLGLLGLALASGWSGANLIFDVLAGTSLRVFYSLLLGVPWIGDPVAQWIFGGPFPAGELIPRLYLMHVFILPTLIAILTGLHLLLVVRQTHTQRPRLGVDASRTIVGEPLWPHQAATSTTLLFGIAGLLAFSAVVIPWSDVGLHGPYVLAQATNASQPDWFMFWVEGALRLMPPFEVRLPGATLSGPFLAGVAMPVLLLASLVAFPWIERRVTGDYGDHHLADHPLAVPLRAAFAAAVVVFLTALSIGATQDIVARLLRVSVERVTLVLQLVAVLGPPAAAAGAWTWARNSGAARRESGR